MLFRSELIEKCYGDKAKKVTRYAIKKEMDIFDVEKLQPVGHAKNRLDIMALRFSLTHFFIDK